MVRKFIQAIKIWKDMVVSPIQIMTIDETISELENGRSIARFGDGEMDLIKGGSEGYQQADPELADELKSVLTSRSDDCLIAVPDNINYVSNLRIYSYRFWTAYMIHNRELWLNYLDRNYRYGNTHISRWYLRYRNKKKCPEYFRRLTGLWKNRDIVIIEGGRRGLDVEMIF